MRKTSLFVRFIALLLCMMTLMPAAYAAKDPVNLNDGVYSYGRFDKNGLPYEKDKPIECAFRSVNYLPVEGGREITCYFAAAEWNDYNIGLPFYVVEYDLGKNIVSPRSQMMAYHPSGRMGLILNERTAYIKLYFYRAGAYIETPLDMIEVAVYYIEDYVDYYIPSLSYAAAPEDTYYQDPLYGKYIIYIGDEIAESRLTTSYNGGAYPQLIADKTHGTFANLAVTGAHLASVKDSYCIVDSLNDLPKHGDLYCFEGGLNDYFSNVKIGQVTAGYSEPVNTKTLCGAMEYIFRYMLMNYPGKPICFVIPHKVRTIAIKPNANGDTFQDFHDAMVEVCNKYSIPYYDAFLNSGLNGWNSAQSNLFLTANENTTGDGTHPNEEGYRRYYLPQMLSLFRSMIAE